MTSTDLSQLDTALNGIFHHLQKKHGNYPPERCQKYCNTAINSNRSQDFLKLLAKTAEKKSSLFLTALVFFIFHTKSLPRYCSYRGYLILQISDDYQKIFQTWAREISVAVKQHVSTTPNSVCIFFVRTNYIVGMGRFIRCKTRSNF